MQSEIKIIQGTKREGKETRIQINALEQKEEIIILLSEQNKETTIQKKKKMRALGTSGTTLNVLTSES